jgi:hypothetical protein
MEAGSVGSAAGAIAGESTGMSEYSLNTLDTGSR